MKTKKAKFEIISLKKFLSILIIAFIAFSCQKEDQQDQNSVLNGVVSLKGKKSKINVCHYDADTDSWKLLNVSINAWKGHQKHGDVILLDEDGDGWVSAINECMPGGDCDDSDAEVNPGLEEIPYNGKDDDCNPETPDDDLDGDGFLNADDCDDTNADVNPNSQEICDNGIDDDCDGNLDDFDSDCEPDLKIGDIHEGGYIFYLAGPNEDLNGDGTPDIGLVAALEDLSAEWGCFGSTIGVFETAVGTGANNTQIILGSACQQSDGVISAAEACNNYISNAYDDWFLPSLGELDLMWENLADADNNGVNNGSGDPGNIGGFDNTYFYWSSTEEDDNFAEDQYFGNGVLDSNNAYKYGTLYVRPARAF